MRAIGLIGIAAFLSMLVIAPPASASSAEEVAGLRAAPCPVSYEAVTKRPWSPEAQQDAMEGRYVVLAGREPVKIEPPADWHFNPIDSRRFQGEYYALNYLDTLFYIYSESTLYDSAGKRAALARARDLALDFIKQNPYGGKGVDPRAWGNKIAGDRVGYLGYLTRAAACEGLLNTRQARKLIHSLAFHGELLSRPSVYSPSNHGLFVDLGLGLLARYGSFLDGAPRWDSLSQGRFRRTLLRRVFPGEGIWLEHSPSYQFLILGTLETFVRATDPEDDVLVALLDRMRAASAAFVMPDGRVAQFGDSYLDVAPAFASPPPGLERWLSPLWTDGLTVFPRSGYAFVRRASTGSYLSIASSFQNTSHKHADELSFELFDRGHRIVNDTGLYEKDDGAYSDFQKSAQAHSTLTADGEDFDLSKRLAYGSGLMASGEGAGWYAVLARNPLMKRQGIYHERLFIYRPAEALIVVDRVGTGKQHRYDRRFQLGPDIAISPRPGALSLSADGLSGEISDDSTLEDVRVRRVNGSRRTLEGFTFPQFRRRLPRWVVDYRSHGADSVHATTISLDPSGPVRAKLPVGADGRSVVLYRDGEPTSRLNVGATGRQLTVTETAP